MPRALTFFVNDDREYMLFPRENLRLMEDSWAEQQRLLRVLSEVRGLSHSMSPRMGRSVRRLLDGLVPNTDDPLQDLSEGRADHRREGLVLGQVRPLLTQGLLLGGILGLGFCFAKGVFHQLRQRNVL